MSSFSPSPPPSLSYAPLPINRSSSLPPFTLSLASREEPESRSGKSSDFFSTSPSSKKKNDFFLVRNLYIIKKFLLPTLGSFFLFFCLMLRVSWVGCNLSPFPALKRKERRGEERGRWPWGDCVKKKKNEKRRRMWRAVGCLLLPGLVTYRGGRSVCRGGAIHPHDECP